MDYFISLSMYLSGYVTYWSLYEQITGRKLVRESKDSDKKRNFWKRNINFPPPLYLQVNPVNNIFKYKNRVRVGDF